MSETDIQKKFQWLGLTRGIFALIGCFMIFLSWQSEEEDNFLGWFGITNDSLFLIGVFFSVLFLISSLERIFSPILELFLTKITITLTITGVVIVCTAEASSIINSVYYVDASLFPFSRSFLTGILFFKKVYPFVMALMGIMVLIFSYQLYDWIKKTGAFGVESHIQHLLFVISTICCIIFFYKFNNKYFHKNILSTKVYALAQTLDFYSNKACKLPKDLENGKFIYIDPNHQYVLVDNTSIEQQDVWGIIRYGVKNNEENDFINFDINPEKPKLSIQKCIS